MTSQTSPPPQRTTQECTLCGKCLEVCPLFGTTGREALAPRAKHFLARMADDPGQELPEREARKLAGACLGCDRCRQACPFKLCAADAVARLKARSPGFQGWLWGQWVAHAGVLWPVMATMAKRLPAFSSGAAGEALKGLRAMDQGQAPEPWLKPLRFEACGIGRKAVLFPGCAASHVMPRWSSTARGLLTGLGFEAAPDPGFACCGKTLGGAGLAAAQAAMQARNVQAWRAAGRPEVAVFCATCLEALRGYASLDLGWEPGEARRWREGILPLATLAGRAEYAVLPQAPERAIYHAPCHGAGGGEPEFLRAALGRRLDAPTAANLCCGFGGALKLSAPALSAQVARRCLDFYGPRPGDRIVTGCSGCVLQLRANAPEGILAGHWLDAIDAAALPGPD